MIPWDEAIFGHYFGMIWDSFGISSPRALLKMIFLFPGICDSFPWRVFHSSISNRLMLDLNLFQRLSFGSSWNPMWFSQRHSASGENHIKRIIQDAETGCFSAKTENR